MPITNFLINLNFMMRSLKSLSRKKYGMMILLLIRKIFLKKPISSIRISFSLQKILSIIVIPIFLTAFCKEINIRNRLYRFLDWLRILSLLFKILRSMVLIRLIFKTLLLIWIFEKLMIQLKSLKKILRTLLQQNFWKEKLVLF